MIEEITYYRMVTALRLNDQGAAELIETFSIDFPNTTILRTVYLDLANYYFKNEKYSYAHKWFAKVEESSVLKTALPEFYLHLKDILFLPKNNIHGPRPFWKKLNLTLCMSPMLTIILDILPTS